MMLVRYWRAHGSPKSLKILPRGEVQIQDLGTETFTIGGRQVQLHKLSVRGLIWGMESVWMDSQDHLIALVSIDAEMDHFEAVADGYEDGLAAFVTGAARDGMANLAKVASGFSSQMPSVTAIVGGRLIDGTGKPAVENAVVILKDGKIAAAGPAQVRRCPQAPRLWMHTARACCRACGRCTRTLSRWSGGQSIWQRALLLPAMWATSGNLLSPRGMRLPQAAALGQDW